MAGRKPILEPELPKVYAALAAFPLRDQALVTLGLNSGFRISELLSLNVGNVWEDGHVKTQLKVTRAKLKGGSGCRKKGVTSRTVPLNATATLILQKYLFSRFGSGPVVGEEALFPSRFHGKRINRSRANVIVHAVLKKAGFENQECYGTHSLRKTFCQSIYKITNHDLNLTRAIMGHGSVSVTQRYLWVDEAEMQSAVMNLSRQFGNSVPAPTEGIVSGGRRAR